jgi:hypothetical protein
MQPQRSSCRKVDQSELPAAITEVAESPTTMLKAFLQAYSSHIFWPYPFVVVPLSLIGL